MPARYLLLAQTVVQSQDMYLVVASVFWAVYGLAAVVSVTIPIDTASLVAVVIALIAPVFGGYVRNIPGWMKKATYAWWSNEAFFTFATAPYGHLFYVDKTAHVWSYELHHTARDLGVAVLVGVIYRALAFVFLVGLNREKQN